MQNSHGKVVGAAALVIVASLASGCPKQQAAPMDHAHIMQLNGGTWGFRNQAGNLRGFWVVFDDGSNTEQVWVKGAAGNKLPNPGLASWVDRTTTDICTEPGVPSGVYYRWDHTVTKPGEGDTCTRETSSPAPSAWPTPIDGSAPSTELAGGTWMITEAGTSLLLGYVNVPSSGAEEWWILPPEKGGTLGGVDLLFTLAYAALPTGASICSYAVPTGETFEKWTHAVSNPNQSCMKALAPDDPTPVIEPSEEDATGPEAAPAAE